MTSVNKEKDQPRRVTPVHTAVRAAATDRFPFSAGVGEFEREDACGTRVRSTLSTPLTSDVLPTRIR
jgi:hypothetical protein